MKYKITLKNKQTRFITILDKLYFKCYERGDGSAHYKTRDQIILSKKENTLIDVDLSESFRFYCNGLGFISDESALFDIYKHLRNPIIKLELKPAKD